MNNIRSIKEDCDEGNEGIIVWVNRDGEGAGNYSSIGKHTYKS